MRNSDHLGNVVGNKIPFAYAVTILPVQQHDHILAERVNQWLPANLREQAVALGG